MMDKAAQLVARALCIFPEGYGGYMELREEAAGEAEFNTSGIYGDRLVSHDGELHGPIPNTTF
jgi:hypothetical protein